MEPFTTTLCALGTGIVSCIVRDPATFGASVVAGMIANPSDRQFCKVIRAVSARLRQPGKDKNNIPVNHDIQRAVRRAYLEATRFVCISHMEIDLGVPVDWKKRDVVKSFTSRKEIRQVEAILKVIDKELKQLPDATYILPESAVVEEAELLFHPQNITPQERLEKLKKMLRESVIQALCKWQPELPENLIQMIRDGWTEKETRFDWFGIMYAFFSELIKNDPVLNRIFQNQLLIRIRNKGEIQQLNLRKQYEKLSEEALRHRKLSIQIGLIVQDIRKDVKATRADVREIKSDVKEIRKHQKASSERIPPEAADRIETLLQEYRTLFVGREPELRQLDDFVSRNSNGVLVITAGAGFGKTALLANWLTDKPYVVRHFFRSGYYDTDRVFQAYRNLLNQLYDYHGIDKPYPRQEEMRAVIYETLRKDARKDEPLIILLDALDEADENFPPPFPPNLPENVFVIASVQQIIPTGLKNGGRGNVFPAMNCRAIFGCPYGTGTHHPPYTPDKTSW